MSTDARAGHYVALVEFVLGQRHVNQFLRACDLGLQGAGVASRREVIFKPHVTADGIDVELAKLADASRKGGDIEILRYTVLSTRYVEDEG